MNSRILKIVRAYSEQEAHKLVLEANRIVLACADILKQAKDPQWKQFKDTIRADVQKVASGTLSLENFQRKLVKRRKYLHTIAYHLFTSQSPMDKQKENGPEYVSRFKKDEKTLAGKLRKATEELQEVISQIEGLL